MLLVSVRGRPCKPHSRFARPGQGLSFYAFFFIYVLLIIFSSLVVIVVIVLFVLSSFARRACGAHHPHCRLLAGLSNPLQC